MKMNYNSMISSAGVLAIVFSTMFAFQNCSDVSFQQSKFVDPFNSITRDPTKLYSLLTVGSTPMPDLKMIFVVDNSYTMTANQVNLANSFANMLSEKNSANLTPFNTTTYLFNTAQLALPATSTKLNSLEQLLFSEAELNALLASPSFDANAFFTMHRPAAPLELSGAIPGDTFGYSLSRWGTGQYSYEFLPMPVLGFVESENGFNLQKGIAKAANLKAEAMVSEFQERLSYLNNLRSHADYPEISDNESGMCALARILKNNNDYVKSGDIPAFVIVSDENEANPTGDKCVDKFNTFVGNEDLIKGYCEERQTTINGTYITIVPERCVVSYKNAYSVSYDYSVPATKVDYYVSRTESPRTKISYYKSNGYTAPRTTINYHELTQQSYKQTRVQFYLRQCEMRDGVIILETCKNVLQPAVVVDGDKVSQCVQTALAINAKALYGDAYLSTEQPACTLVAPRLLSSGQSCALDDSNCVSTISLKTTTVYGIYSALQSECNTRTSSLTKALVDENHQPVCTPASDRVEVAGVCPSTYPNCQQSLLYFSAESAAIVNGDYTTTNAACQDRAGQLTAAYVNSNYPATCEKYTNLITPCNTSDPEQLACARSANIEGEFSVCADFVNAKKSQMPGIILDDAAYVPACSTGTPIAKNNTKSVSFTSAILTNPLLPIDSLCTAELFNAYITTESTLPRDGICKVKGYRSTTYTENVNNNTCEQIKSLFDTANAGAVAESSVQHYPQAEKSNPYTRNIKEDITCSTPCSGTAFCTAATNANTSSTIDNYLKSIYGSSFACATGSIVKTKVSGSDFSDKLASSATSICKPSSNNVKRYLVQLGSIYRFIGPTSDFVTGSKVISSQTQPANNLAQYISDRSVELFGSETAMLTTFVRQPQDGVGQGGSVGVEYERLADLMGGQKFSVMMNDYSPALKELGQIIKSKLERSYVVQNLVPPQKIYNVWVRRIHEDPELLDPLLWMQSGATLTLDESIRLEYGEHIQVEYY